MSSKLSFDGAFSAITRKYGLTPREAKDLYKIAYKVVVYYHSIRFMASYTGYSPSPTSAVEYLYTKGFDLEGLVDQIRELSRSLSETMRISLLYGFPHWFVRDLYGKLPHSALENMLKSLNERKRWLRVNTLKYSIADAIECLEKTGIRVKGHSTFKDLLLLEDPFIKIGSNPCVVNRVVIPQDISSYITAKLLEETAEDLIDACSSPGIKLLQILSKGKANRAISVDISEDRATLVYQLAGEVLGKTPRLIVVVGDSRVLQYNLRNAVTIIDAPCSDSGAVYANPAIKLYLTRKKVKGLHVVQLNLIRNNLKQGNRALFVTCSIHPLEGEELIGKILNAHKDVKLLELSAPHLKKGYLGYPHSKSTYRIYPHEVNGQGFFLSMLEAS
ncbi:MAG: RsmB/NOP family class I SAM-dependent RNA methyltransferase [Desulfurococcaceae archaeon]